MQATDIFPPEYVERARRYHRPLYLALLLDLVLGLALAALLAFAWPGDRLYDATGGGWALRALEFTALVVAVSTAVRLPLSFWRGYLHERRWGFSTQGLRGWLTDQAKGFALGLVLIEAAILGFLTLVHALPRWWPLATAAAAAALVLLLSFLGPVVFEPVFNKFEPLADEELARELRALAAEAGVPVRDVLVADASRRTKKVNAYVSGFGATRRVVLYDTLLEKSDSREIRLVVAHELGHRRLRHIVQGTALGMAGAALTVVVLWALLRRQDVLDAIGATGPGDPRVVPFLMLVATALELVGLPLRTALSRRWERQADRFSLELTQDPEAFEKVHRELAEANLSDVDPPRALYLVLFTHPTPPERVEEARRFAAAQAA